MRRRYRVECETVRSFSFDFEGTAEEAAREARRRGAGAVVLVEASDVGVDVRLEIDTWCESCRGPLWPGHHDEYNHDDDGITWHYEDDPRCVCAPYTTREQERDERQDVRVRDFLAELATLCRRTGYVLSHEDEHGAFLVRRHTDDEVGWLLDARDLTRSS